MIHINIRIVSEIFSSSSSSSIIIVIYRVILMVMLFSRVIIVFSSRLSPFTSLTTTVDLKVRLAGALVQRSVSVREEGRPLGLKQRCAFWFIPSEQLPVGGPWLVACFFGRMKCYPLMVTVSKKTKNPYKPIRISFILRVFFHIA